MDLERITESESVLCCDVWADEADEDDPMIGAVTVCVLAGSGTNVLAVPRREAPEVLCMPGGKVERTRYDEPPRRAAVRELLEETGLAVRRGDLQWIGAVEVARSTAGGLFVGVFSVAAPPGYVPEPSMGEPGLPPRWVPISVLADERRSGRFAKPAMLAKIALGLHR